jgi:hypothetical protein
MSRALALLLCLSLFAFASVADAQPRGPGARPGGPPGGGPAGGGPPGGGPGGLQRPGGPYAGPAWIDTHVHLRGGGRSYAEVVDALAAMMPSAGMRMALLLPPPFTDDGANQGNRYDSSEMAASIRPHAGRFAFLAGGSALNPIIQTMSADKVTPQVSADFSARAEKMLDEGAVGFGEIGILHLSHFTGHPFEDVAADHPLILALADIAAKRGKVLDLHMDLVEHAAPLPTKFASPPNPRQLTPNLPALERLLVHNPNAKIVWAHAGWDVTGQWGVEVSRLMLQRHPNLYMSLKLMPGETPEHMPITPAGVKPEWQALLSEFPDRFVIGTDSFIAAPDGMGPARTIFIPAPVQALLSKLPPPLAEAVAHGNAERIYGLKPAG